MTTHSNIILVPVPVGASDFDFNEKCQLTYNVDGVYQSAQLPLRVGTTYTLHGIATTLSEDVCKGLVPLLTIPATRVPIKKYPNYQDAKSVKFNYATESLISLIKHYGYDPEGCVVVGIEKEVRNGND